MEERALLTELYRQMVVIRRMEEAAARAYGQGLIGGFLHLYIGQEAVGVGAIAALQADDYVLGTYREHGQAYAKGISVKAIMAELYAKETGISHGRGGSMHLFDASRGFLGGHAIVGGHVPLAAGVAFASKYRGDKRVTLCFMGEGSASMGAFHEGLSLAALWHLPVVYVVENNLYAMGTPLYRSLSVEDVSVKAISYGMARDRFDGSDVMTVYNRIGQAVARAREQSEPALVEVQCYRFRGHSMSDPGLYRTKAEVEEWKRRDPLLVASGKLRAMGVGDEELKALDAAAAAEVKDAVKFAESSAPPDEADLTKYVYAEE